MMFSNLFVVILVALSSAAAQNGSWPNGPFHTDGRYIKDASNETVKIAGVNWVAHGEVMIPEGLQHRSIQEIVTQITSIGLNAIRLTYATQMIDQLMENFGQDITIEKAFHGALGLENGTYVLDQVLYHNPSFSKNTTRLEVFDAVAAECARQHVYIHLDNHMSRGTWCCSGTDGNGWWGDRDFDVAKWIRGHEYLANRGKQWPSLISIALRNEIRKVLTDLRLRDDAYTWAGWYEYMRLGAEAIHNANEDLIIVFGGLSYGHVIDPVFRQEALTPGEKRFDRSDFVGYGNDKIVLEIHNYDNAKDSYGNIQYTLYFDGFQGMNASDPDTKDVYPVMLTEFGHAMEGEGYLKSLTFRSVLRDVLPDAGYWFHWVLCGSYYYRILRGERKDEETWGLLNENWTAWRNEEFINDWLKPQIDATLS
nr:beta-1,6-galactanase [Colletotrichum truncatum]KAF6799889.1 beta-1,6-galactanase [Colletotrichum truncatum]